MAYFPSVVKIIGLENRVISLVALAWLLLAIDVNLKLGVVDRIVGIAKAFREL